MTYEFHGLVRARSEEYGDTKVVSSYGPFGTLDELWRTVTEEHDPVMVDLTIQAEGVMG